MIKQKRTRTVLSYLGTYLFWIVGSILTLVPIYWIIVVSSRKRIELLSGKGLFRIDSDSYVTCKKCFKILPILGD